MKTQQTKIILYLSLILGVLVGLVSYIGFFTQNFYTRETINWRVQSTAQDMVDLFLITPALLITSFFVYRNNKTALLLWAGIIAYLVYTFTIYCFDLHFNNLFVLYCFTLGLSFYVLLYFSHTQLNEKLLTEFTNSSVAKITGTYFIVISILFCFSWLSDIFHAIINHTIPPSLRDSGLPSNPIHIIDLSVFLPGLFITGVLLLRKRPLGLQLAPVFLTFFILMDITIAVLTIIMKQNNLQSDLGVAVMMGFLALFSLMLLLWYIKSMKSPSIIKLEQELKARHLSHLSSLINIL